MIPEEMETPVCQVPRNVLLLVVVWCLRCNNQKEGETKDSPSESAKINENLLELVIGNNTFIINHHYYYYILICY